MISKYIFIQSKQICIPKKKTFLLYNFFSFHAIKIFFILYEFFIRYFYSAHIWSAIFICKSKFYFHYVAARCCYDAATKHHYAVRKLLRRIQNIRTLWNESYVNTHRVTKTW